MVENGHRSSGWSGTITLFAVVLVFLGLAFLIHNFKLTPPGFWGVLWRFWPVLLILVGLKTLIGSGRSILVGSITAFTMFAVLGLSLYISWSQATEQPTITNVTEKLGSYNKATIAIEFGAGDLKLDGMAGTGNLMEATAEHRGASTGISKEFTQAGGIGQLKLTLTPEARRLLGEKKDKWQLHFSRDVPLDINFKSGLSNLDLDMSSLKVDNLNLDIGASKLHLQLPVSGTSKVAIKSGVAEVEISIPQGKAAKIKVAGGLSSSDIDEKRFPHVDEYYISPDFNSNSNRVEMEIGSGLSRIKIK